MFENILDLIYPPKCGFCKKINKDYLCRNCELKIESLKKDKIVKVKNKDFSHFLYAYEYKDEIRKIILNYKFNDQPDLCDTFVKLLLNNKKICRFLKSYDIIIPVPMYRKKQVLRGYNQTEIIAKNLAKELHLEFKEILIKSHNTKTQSSLNAIERKTNVEGAYECIDLQKIKDKNVVIFDDIFTTRKYCRGMCKTACNSKRN